MTTLFLLLAALGAPASAAPWPCPQKGDVDGATPLDEVVLTEDRAQVRTGGDPVNLPLPTAIFAWITWYPSPVLSASGRRNVIRRAR